MQVWPGQRYPLGATYDGTGTNFALFSEVAESVELCLFDEWGLGNERRVKLHEVDAFVWHAYLPASSPASGTASACTAPYEPGTRPALQPAQAAARPVRQGGRRRRRVAPGGLRLRLRRPGPDVRRPTRRRTCPRRVVVNPYFDWGNDRPPRHPVPPVGDLRGARQGPDPAAPGHPGGAARHVRRRSRHPAIIEHLTELGVTAIELMPVHQFVHDNRLVDLRPAQLLGLQHDRLLRARTTATRRWAGSASRCRSSAAWSRRCTRPASRSSSTWSTTTPPRATTSARRSRFKGIDNPSYYRLSEEDRRYYVDYTGTGNTPQRAQPALAAADHGLAALLGAARCTSTASASTSPPPWPASSTRSTGSPRSSRWCSRTRWSARSS